MKENELSELKARLKKVEAELEKCRGASPLIDGWQTSKYARKSRKWDILAQEKMELIIKIEELTKLWKN